MHPKKIAKQLLSKLKNYLKVIEILSKPMILGHALTADLFIRLNTTNLEQRRGNMTFTGPVGQR